MEELAKALANNYSETLFAILLLLGWIAFLSITYVRIYR